LIGRKDKGPAADKHTDPKRMTEIKRLLNSRRGKIESQETQLLLKFLSLHPQIDTTLATIEALWGFLKFLKSSGFYIVNKEEVFCFPLAKMVRLSKLGGRDEK